MNIVKIGGAVLKNLDGFRNLINIIDNHSTKPLIIVISAFSSATRELKESALLAEKGKLKSANEIVNKIINEHKTYAKELISESDVLDSLLFLFENSKERLSEIMKGLSITKELTLRTLDTVMSYGEFFALHTVYHYLQGKKYNISCVDSTSLIVSDNNFGEAKPLIFESTKLITEKLKPLMTKDKIIVTQGFVAKNKSGEITTMGIESSNLTAVLLAEVLNIKQITFWTDVMGVRTADPKLVSSTQSIPILSYKQAYDYALNGLKLIYPEMVNHAAIKKIKLIYKSAINPKGDFTQISETKAKALLPLITFIEKAKLADYKYSSKLPDIVQQKKIIDNFSNVSAILTLNYNTDGFQILYSYDEFIEDELKRLYPNIVIQDCSYLSISFKEIGKILNAITKFIIPYFDKIPFINLDGSNLKIAFKNSNIVEITNKVHKQIIKSLNN